MILWHPMVARALTTHDLCHWACVSRECNGQANAVINLFPRVDLVRVVNRAIAPDETSMSQGVIQASRQIVATELIENCRLGYQANCGRVLWPPFLALIKEVAMVLKSRENGDGFLLCQRLRLSERVCWLAMHVRLCADYITTSWLRQQEDLRYLASRGVLFATEFKSRCIRHGEEKEKEKERDESSPSDKEAAGAATSSVMATVPAIESAIQFASSSRQTPTNASAVKHNDQGRSHCLECHPLAYLTQRCLFDCILILKRSEEEKQVLDQLLWIVTYAVAFQGHLGPEQQRVMRLMMIHILRRARSSCPSSPLPFLAPSALMSMQLIRAAANSSLITDVAILREILEAMQFCHRSVKPHIRPTDPDDVHAYLNAGSCYVI